MSDRPIGLGKVAENGTLNENGAFYSVQDINVLLENGGGSSGGGDLPTPTVADAGSVVVVDEEGKYALGEAGGGGDALLVEIADGVMNKSYNDLLGAMTNGKNIIIHRYDAENEEHYYYYLFILSVYEGSYYATIGVGIPNTGLVTSDYSALSADAPLSSSH